MSKMLKLLQKSKGLGAEQLKMAYFYELYSHGADY